MVGTLTKNNVFIAVLQQDELCRSFSGSDVRFALLHSGSSEPKQRFELSRSCSQMAALHVIFGFAAVSEVTECIVISFREVSERSRAGVGIRARPRNKMKEDTCTCVCCVPSRPCVRNPS